MVAVAKTIIERAAGEFEPDEFRDRYQEALRELVDSKAAGKSPAHKRAAEQPQVIDLMEALKRSLAEGGSDKKPARKGKAPDRRQGAMLLPMEGGKGRAKEEAPAKEAPARGKSRSPAPKAAAQKERKQAS